jgi:hypothetical protein
MSPCPSTTSRVLAHLRCFCSGLIQTLISILSGVLQSLRSRCLSGLAPCHFVLCPLFLFCFIYLFIYFLRHDLYVYPRLDLNSLCNSDWPGTLDPPAQLPSWDYRHTSPSLAFVILFLLLKLILSVTTRLIIQLLL